VEHQHEVAAVEEAIDAVHLRRSSSQSRRSTAYR
jgi:hypothetical protein